MKYRKFALRLVVHGIVLDVYLIVGTVLFLSPGDSMADY